MPDAATPHRLVGQVRFRSRPGFRAGLPCSVGGGCQRRGRSAGVPYNRAGIRRLRRRADHRSWDSYADLDLHVADPNGDEVYYGSEEVESGGVARPRFILWTQAYAPERARRMVTEERPPPGSLRGAPQPLQRMLTVPRPTTSSTSTTTDTSPPSPAPSPVPRRRSSRGTGEVITQFDGAGDDAPPAGPGTLSSTYRGSGDQVFVLNPDGETLDDTLYTLTSAPRRRRCT